MTLALFVKSGCWKLFILFGIFYSLSANSQNWKTAWGSSCSGHPGALFTILNIDSHNNTYTGTAYNDSIFIEDTMFVHPQNIGGYYAIAKYNRFGKFLKAIDIYSVPSGAIFYVYCTTDAEDNLYICCEFQIRAFLLDSVINHGTGPYPESPDIFLAKIGADYKIKWIKTISGPYQDDVWGFAISEDQHFYIATQHYGNDPVVKQLCILGQDTINYEKNLCTVIKTDTNGEIQWISQITGARGMEGSSLQIGEDDNIYYDGSSWDDIYVDGDTIPYPPNARYTNGTLLLSYSPEGALHSGQFSDNRLADFRVNQAGEIYYDNVVYDTLYIGQDTLHTSGDTTMWIVGKFSPSLQPVWYHTIKRRTYNPNNNNGWVSIDEKNDTLYFTTPADRIMVFMDSLYQVGTILKAFICQLDHSGNLIHQQFFSAEPLSHLIPWSIALDGCSNPEIAGQFFGEAVFGEDTITSYNYIQADGFVAAARRNVSASFLGPDTAACDQIILHGPPGCAYYDWNNGLSNAPDLTVNQSGIFNLTVSTVDNCWLNDTVKVTVISLPQVDLGRDTTIHLKDTLSLSAPAGYDRYEWSTGDTIPVIRLLGTSLGTGNHEISVAVYDSICLAGDSVRVTVVWNEGVLNQIANAIRVYPVPSPDKVHILLPAGDFEISLLSQQGVVLFNTKYSYKVPETTTIDISSFTKGSYLLRIRTRKEVLTKMILKL